MKPVKLGLLGVGTVGASTALVLKNNAVEIARRAGRDIEVVHASRKSVSNGIPDGSGDIILTADPFEVVDNPQVDIVVELIGGYEPARDLVLRAIENGKHVVTANKALIAMHGNEIFAAALAKGVNVAFEAAVAGGIPIIKALREGLSANHIEWLAGIINGTGNFILTEMRDKGRDFEDVLQEAQALGYAEADPTFDVEGIDAAHKLCILSSLAFGIPLQFDAVYTEGITQISTEDVVYAGQLGYRIKHLGIARRTPKGIEMRVHPTLIPDKRLIANVETTSYAVFAQGTYDISESVAVTLGLRYTDDEKEGTNENILFGPLFIDEVGTDSQETTGKIAVDWKFSDSSLLYASFSHGYKSGGINQVAIVSAGREAIYDP